MSAIYNGVGVAVMRRFYPKGSLRDVIYGVSNFKLSNTFQPPRVQCRPQGHVLKKYGVPQRWRILSVADVTKYGRQILEVCINVQSQSTI